MLFELWKGDLLLHATQDPNEMVIYYRDAMRVYEANELTLLAHEKDGIRQLNYYELRNVVRMYERLLRR